MKRLLQLGIVCRTAWHPLDTDYLPSIGRDVFNIIQEG